MQPFIQRAVIVQVEFPKQKEMFSSMNALAEFRDLVNSSGVEISHEDLSKQNKPTAGLFIGKGKAERIKRTVEESDSDLVIFNHDLTPSQERNLEGIFNARVLDRTGLILDIFASRATSHIGKLQVELAQLSHLSTRLVRGWSHLERQKGGIGLRGPGETQLETDRRLINQRIKNIKNKLEKSHKQREVNRYSRKKSKQTLVALVGYTNAGKTTLFNLLTESHLYSADKLFATLDSITRRSSVSGLDGVLFSDTVGFISDLPPQLIESFKATLDELKSANLLVQVIDISDPDFRYKTEQVALILEELGVSDIPQIKVFNKCDKANLNELKELSSNLNNDVWISALNKTGVDKLLNAIHHLRHKSIVKRWIELEPKLGNVRARLYSLGRVIDERTTDTGLIQLQLEIDKKELSKLISVQGIGLTTNNIKEII